jgi:REP element-mobilizing transposase RayT
MSRDFYDNVYYFITIPTTKHLQFFDTPEKKSLILTRLEKSKALFQLDDFDYSILSNHYHLFSHFQNGGVIPKLLQMINGGSAYELNKIIENRKPVWVNILFM